MKAIRARMTMGLHKDSRLEACDNSGAKLLKIVSVKGFTPPRLNWIP